MATQRLQVLFEAEELDMYREIARVRSTTVADWVRQAVRRAAREEPLASVEEKLVAVRAAARHEFPIAEVDEMNAEIARGYLASGV